MQIKLRQATTEDVPFIFSAWLKSYRNNPFTKSAPNTVYYKFQHELIEKVLARGQCIVACADDDSDVILGFVVLEERAGSNIVHYIYVKQPYRKLKIASQLLACLQRIDFYTHMNGKIHPRLSEAGAVYCPYLFFL